MKSEGFVVLSTDKLRESTKTGLQAMKTHQQGAILGINLRSHAAREWH